MEKGGLETGDRSGTSLAGEGAGTEGSTEGGRWFMLRLWKEWDVITRQPQETKTECLKKTHAEFELNNPPLC